MVRVNNGHSLELFDVADGHAFEIADELVDEACRIADTINTAIEAASATKTASTRHFQLDIAKQSLERLKQIAGTFPFIELQGIGGVERQITELQLLVD